MSAENVSRHGGAGKQKSREVEDGIDPVGPSGDEAVEWAKGFARPGVETTFFREARGQLVDDQGARNEEEDCGQTPEADRGCSIVAGGCDLLCFFLGFVVVLLLVFVAL